MFVDAAAIAVDESDLAPLEKALFLLGAYVDVREEAAK